MTSPNVGADVGQLEFSHTLVEILNWFENFEQILAHFL